MEKKLVDKLVDECTETVEEEKLLLKMKVEINIVPVQCILH